MKKILLAVAAVIFSMTASAQMIEITKTEGGKTTTVAQYKNSSSVTYKAILTTTTGTAKATINGQEVDVNWVQLWEDGPKWAVYNLGATSISECGSSYNWGASEARTDDNKNQYSSSTTSIQGTDDDTATNIWGSNWQMPTDDDFLYLVRREDGYYTSDECYTDGGVWKSAEESGYGVAGMLIKGKTGTIYSANSIFLPASGTPTRFWTSQHSRYDDVAIFFSFDANGWVTSGEDPNKAYHVRAILKE